ncbi:hypothetical protein ES692_08415 [Psychroserpens burtonensis]|uniref:Tetratricopeptide repeat protein n=1 Tax=Psychroserpens burtonensis TaxID=49278 RepID=A0A5C7BE59_9FLAO|nr:hypothetical protein [Psychroserpens burtonensis]TXE17581.1 hypothetical protein ES692_08415 [Psychroserpens burtonensis]
MTDLNAIVSTFSSEDEQHFIKYLEKKNKRSDTKNIELFKLLTQNELSSKAICKTLYKADNKVAYHALRKRLYQSLIDFIANLNLEEENSVDMQIFKYILASRTFLIHKKPNIAYKILDNAERLAQEHQLFPILNEIYHTKIQYAYLNPSVDINVLIANFRSNQKHHFIEEELNIVYAKIRQTLNDMIYKGKVLDFETILNNTLKEHNIEISESLSFKSLYQLMTIVSLSAFVTNNYLKIEPFLIATYEKIKNHKTRDKQLVYHIQVVYMIANTLFRNKKFKESLEHLDVMNDLMHQQRKKHYSSFKLKYYLLAALNHNYSNTQDKAIELLESVKQTKHADIESLLDINLGLVMFYIQKAEFKEAKTIFSKFYHTDKYYIEKAGKEWIIKKNIAEIILYIELGELDLIESRLKSFKRSYFDYLMQIKQERVITFIKIVEYFYKNPEHVTSQKFKDKVEHSFRWINEQQEDIFVMSFYAWLKSKMENKTLYETTLALVKKAQGVN